MRNKVVEIHQSGKGYQAICETLGLQKTTFRTIIHKWREVGVVGIVPGGVIDELGIID